MIFRDYKPDDYTQLISFWYELGLSNPERGDSRESIERTIAFGGKLLLMVDIESDAIIGSSWMTYDGRRVYIHHFGIKQFMQGKGFGTLMAEESFKFIKEKGCQVKLEVHKNNFKAKNLYEKFGFFAFSDYDIYMIRNLDRL